MLTRIVTGTLAAAIALAAILWREPWAFFLLTVLVLVAGVLELRPFVPTGALWIAGAALFNLIPFMPTPASIAQLAAIGLFWLIGSFALLLWRPNNRAWVVGLNSWVWMGALCAIVLQLQSRSDIGTLGPNLLIIALVPLWVGDSLAYFVGKAIGKHKLAPSISPNKTWEGAIANLVGCLAAAYAIGLWLEIPLSASIAVGLTTGILGQVGDLLQSRLKRLAEVKDSGSILPGHGGVLDRLDSFLFSSYPSLLALYLLAPETFHVKQWPW